MRLVSALGSVLVLMQSIAQSTRTATPLPDDVAPVIEQLRQTYEIDKPVSVSGTITVDMDAGGVTATQSRSFSMLFDSPSRFRHEVTDDALVVSDGNRAYAYLPAGNEYVSAASPASRSDGGILSGTIGDLLQDQNPVVLMLLSSDPAAPLLEGAKAVAREAEPPDLAGKVRIVVFKRDQVTHRVSVDVATGQITTITRDHSRYLRDLGVEEAKSARVTITYDRLDFNPAIDDSKFKWSLPRGARLAKPEEEVSAGGAQDPSDALVGKPAPGFELNDIDGKPVKLADFKGSVVVLDFWATWCGPCVASMPHLDALRSEFEDKGVKVLAINLREADKLVRDFMQKRKLGLHVVMDRDGAVAKRYSVGGIPQTVVVGKDGLVRKVIVGFGGDDSQLRSAVQDALK